MSATGMWRIWSANYHEGQQYGNNYSSASRRVSTNTWTNRTMNGVYFSPTGIGCEYRWIYDPSAYSTKRWLENMSTGIRFFRGDFSTNPTVNGNVDIETTDTIVAYGLEYGEEITVNDIPAECAFSIPYDNILNEDSEYEVRIAYTPVANDTYDYLVVMGAPNVSNRPTSRHLTVVANGCTANAGSGTYSAPQALTRIFTANNGYAFDINNPDNNIIFTGRNTTYTVSSVTVDTLQVRINNGYNDVTLEVDASLTQGFQFTANCTNCTCDLANGLYEAGSELTAHFTPNESVAGGYELREAPTFNIDGVVVNYNSETGIYTATFTINEAVIATAKATYYTYFNMATLAFCTTNIDGETRYYEGETVNITITALTGYMFEEAPYIAYFNEMGFPTNFVAETTDSGEYKQNYTLAFSAIGNNTTVAPNVRFAAIVIPDTDKYGIISVYNPTPDELKTMTAKRFRRFTDGLGQVTFIDCGEWIVKLIKLYINIPPYDKQNINLGGYDMEVASNVILRDIQTTDCGIVEIPPYFNNVMDYNNTKIKIYLPFRGFETLDTAAVMGESLHLFYRTNVLNGDTLIMIYGNNNRLLYTFECNCSFEIPYILNGDNEIKGQLNIDSSYLYGFTPFIEIERDTAFNTAPIIAETDLYAVIGDLEGYNEITVTNNTIVATDIERNEIVNILKQGVLL